MTLRNWTSQLSMTYLVSANVCVITASHQSLSCRNPAPMNGPNFTATRKRCKLRRSNGRKIVLVVLHTSTGMFTRSRCPDSKYSSYFVVCSTAVVSFLRNERLRQSPEFRDLPPATQEFLELPTIPDYELATHSPPLFVNADEELKPTDTYLSILVFAMNPQSTGSVQLHSKDPKDQLLIDPQLLSHPFDRRAAIEAMRTTLEMIEMPSLKNDTIKLVGGPKSSSDEDVLVCDYFPIFSYKIRPQSSLLTDWLKGIYQNLPLLFVAHVRDRQNGQTIRLNRMRQQRFPSLRCAEPPSRGYEYCALAYQVSFAFTTSVFLYSEVGRNGC